MRRLPFDRLTAVLSVIALLFILHTLNVASGNSLVQYGILPRTPQYWYHVGLAPFIHGSYAHLYGNAIGLAAFGTLCALRSKTFFFTASAFIIVVGGALVWALGRTAMHFGASGWVYGLWALILSMAWFDRKPANIAIAIVVMLAYSGMSYGLLPMDPTISFEMHIAGVVAGVLFAFLYTRFNARRTGD